MNVVVYVPLFDNFEDLPMPNPDGKLPRDCKVRHVCLTDKSCPQSVEGWEYEFPRRYFKDDPRRESRRCIALSHKYFPDADVTIMHGASLRLLATTAEVLEWLDDADMAAFKHPHRDCIYDEAKVVLALGKDAAANVEPQMEAYKAEGFPAHYGLAALTMLVRRHTDAVAAFNTFWWGQVKQYSVRDQLSFNYVCWKLGMTYGTFPGELHDTEHWVWRRIHG